MANFCERCANTGVAQAALVKNQETFDNEYIAVVLCSEYSDTTDKTLEALSATGLEVRIVGKASSETIVPNNSSSEEERT